VCGSNVSSNAVPCVFGTGLGIGGVALAFTARTFIEDGVNALCMYIDQPFKVGEMIQINDIATAKGDVEHIGLKSTRIRARTGELLIFPNSMIAGARIQNFHQMEFRKGELSFVRPARSLAHLPERILTNLHCSRSQRVSYKTPSKLVYTVTAACS